MRALTYLAIIIGVLGGFQAAVSRVRRLCIRRSRNHRRTEAPGSESERTLVCQAIGAVILEKLSWTGILFTFALTALILRLLW